MRIRKKCILLLLILAMASAISACGGESTVEADKNRHVLRLSVSDLSSEEREGFFVLNEDNTFTPLMTEADGYRGILTEEDASEISSRYLWWTDNQDEKTARIPVVSKDSPLVCYFTSSEHMPASISLEKYREQGYTIGCHFAGETNHSVYLISEEPLKGSFAEEALRQISDERSYRINAINGSSNIPYQNVDHNIGLLLGLEKNAKYELQFYKGTQYVTMTTYADAFVLQAERVLTIQNPYRKTKQGFFYVNLPDSLEEGYYYFNGKGLFWYEK